LYKNQTNRCKNKLQRSTDPITFKFQIDKIHQNQQVNYQYFDNETQAKAWLHKLIAEAD